MMFNTQAVSSALNKTKDTSTSCAPSEVAVALFDLIPENIRALFRAPRGVKKENVGNEEGEYLCSVIQVAKGTMGRLHGPAFEVLAYQILTYIVELDERSEEERMDPKADPGIIRYNGEDVVWDVRRYSSSMNNGRWQTIPDYSLYIGCTQAEMRDGLKKETSEETVVNQSNNDDNGW